MLPLPSRYPETLAYTELTDGRSTFHDDLQNLKVWPKAYDGRAIISKSYEDHVSGVAIEENIKRLSEAQASGDMSRNLIWAYVFPSNCLDSILTLSAELE